MNQKYDKQDKILFDTILRQPAELYLSVYSIVITFVASGTCLTHSNCLLQHFPFLSIVTIGFRPLTGKLED